MEKEILGLNFACIDVYRKMQLHITKCTQ